MGLVGTITSFEACDIVQKDASDSLSPDTLPVLDPNSTFMITFNYYRLLHSCEPTSFAFFRDGG